MTAVWYRFRAELRTRWRAWLGLALLIGVATGAVLTLAAGARRTDSAYSRFLQAQHAADVVVVQASGDASPELARFDPDEIARLATVARVDDGQFFFAQLGDGVPALADGDGTIGRAVDRVKILEGRAADPEEPDEAVVSFQLADELSLELGDAIPLADPSVSELSPEERADPEARAFFDLNRRILAALPDGAATIVGIGVAPGDLPPVSMFHAPVRLTPAFDRIAGTSSSTVTLSQEIVLVRLEHGADDVPAFRRQLERLSEGRPFQLVVAHEQAANAQRDIHRQAVALWLLAGLLAVTSALVVGQLLARSATLEASESTTLGALGLSQVQRFGLGMLRPLAITIMAAGVAVVVAVAASPLLPLGIARTAEPDLGLAVDTVVLGLGVLTTIVGLVALVAWPTWRAAGPGDRATRGTRRRRGVADRLATGASGVNLPVPAVTGMRMALESGRGPTAVPVRSTLTCVTLGVVTLVAVLTFGASLAHLLDTPRLYGVVWDATVFSYEDGVDLPRDAPPVLRHQGVTGIASGYDSLPLRARGVTFGALALDSLYGDALPPLLSGRHSGRPAEIVVGSRTLDELGVGIGDTISVRLQGSAAARFRVVGTAVIPPVSDVARLGEGAVVTLAGARRLFPALDEVEPPVLYLRLDDPSTRDEALGALTRALDLDPDALDTERSDSDETFDLVSFGRVERMPLLLAAILAVLAAATLAHVLVSGVRRRRRDLAMLKTLGFVRRQVSATVAWQATTVAAVALVVGVPLGIVVGRTAWRAFAEDLGVVVVPRVPIVATLLVVAGALVLANLIAAGPAWVAARTRPAAVLQEE